MERKGSPKDMTRLSQESRVFCRTRLWRLPGPAVWKILVWRILTNTLSIGVNFARRNIDLDHCCKLCSNDGGVMETMEHLFRDCEMAKRLWMCSDLGIKKIGCTSISLANWIINWMAYLEKMNDAEFLVKTADISIEKALKIKDVEPLNEQDPFENDFVRIRNSNPVHFIGVAHSCEQIRVMVDAGWKSTCIAGIGWVALTGTGNRFYEYGKAIVAESATQAEAIAVKDVLLWAMSSGYWHLEISSVCLPLICHFTEIERAHHLASGILDDIHSLSASFHCLSFSYIPRSCNMYAHSLAKKAMNR
ncbi:uncharacterized protein LOC141588171 [Silene latifolia]|uniref:uncharacterized protein LOC141588171 n=1 Tax=Silene latifolia TaxID=37657 RepID=UPI003D76ED6D